MTKDELTPIDTSKYKITETGQVLKMTKGDKRKMKVIGAVTIGKLIEAHYERDEHKFKSYAEFIADVYNEMGEERAERIIRSKIDGTYKNKPVAVTLDKEIKND